MWWRRFRYVLVLVALCAIATCPTAKRSCTAKREAREADDLLDFLADKVAASARATGKVPPLGAGPTPTPSCCDQGGTCSPDRATFTAPGWAGLGFTIDDTYRYTYQYIPAANGGSAVIRAVGDLDCDGEASTFEVEITLEPGAGGASVTRKWTRKAQYE